jgi:hypothetical protein
MVVQQLSKMAAERTGKVLEGVFGEADSSPKLPSINSSLTQYHFLA